MIRILLICIVASKAWASPYEMQFTGTPSQDEYDQMVLELYSPMRFTAGRQIPVGAFSVVFDAQERFYTLSEETQSLTSQYLVNGDSLSNTTSFTTANISTTAGPFNMAISTAALPNTDVSVFGMAFAFNFGMILNPLTASIRYGFTDVLGIADTQVCSDSFEFRGGTGDLLGILEAYGGLGVASTAIETRASETMEHSWNTSYQLIGLRLPVAYILTLGSSDAIDFTIEAQRSSQPDQYTALAQLSFVMRQKR